MSLGAADDLSEVRLTAAPLPVIDVTPRVIDSSVTEQLSGLRAGQTLTLVDGGSLPDNFNVVDATLNVQGGNLGFNAQTAGSVVNISGGTVVGGFQAYSGSEVNISGGTVGDNILAPFVNLGAGAGSVVNISGGWVNGLEADSGSIVNISGGVVVDGSFFESHARSGSIVNITGGTVIFLRADSGSEVNITGTQFLLNGELLDALVVGESFTITEPMGRLTGILADGSSFAILVPNASNPTITVTLVPPVILGDVDLNGVVDFLDINPFIQVLATEGFQAEADCNQDGAVDFLDIQVFIDIVKNTLLSNIIS